MEIEIESPAGHPNPNCRAMSVRRTTVPGESSDEAKLSATFIMKGKLMFRYLALVRQPTRSSW